MKPTERPRAPGTAGRHNAVDSPAWPAPCMNASLPKPDGGTGYERCGPLDRRPDGDDASAVPRQMRPLVASRFHLATDRAIPGSYDAARQLRLDENGVPIARTAAVAETMTEARAEPTDPSGEPLWLLDTQTAAVPEQPDDHLAMTETMTKARPEPADAVSPTDMTSADDSVTGLVAF